MTPNIFRRFENVAAEQPTQQQLQSDFSVTSRNCQCTLYTTKNLLTVKMSFYAKCQLKVQADSIALIQDEQQINQ